MHINVLGSAPVVAHGPAPPIRHANAGRAWLDRKVRGDPIDHLLNSDARGRRRRRHRSARAGSSVTNCEVPRTERHHRDRKGVGLERPVGHLLLDPHDLLELASQFVIHCSVELGPEQRRDDNQLIARNRHVIRRVQGAPELKLKGRRRIRHSVGDVSCMPSFCQRRRRGSASDGRRCRRARTVSLRSNRRACRHCTRCTTTRTRSQQPSSTLPYGVCLLLGSAQPLYYTATRLAGFVSRTNLGGEAGEGEHPPAAPTRHPSYDLSFCWKNGAV